MGRMNVFAYDNGFNGVSFYRCWQVMNHLDKDIRVRRLPDRSDGVIMPMEGMGGNVPGCESHEVVTNWADVLFSTYRSDIKTATRLAAQGDMKPLILDLDDDVWNVPQSTGYTWEGWRKANEKIFTVKKEDLETDELKEACKQGWMLTEHDGVIYLHKPNPKNTDSVELEISRSKVVTVSTPEMARVVSRFHSDVVVIPNAIDFAAFPARQRANDGLIRISLVGSLSHYRDWREAADSIKQILNEFPNVRLVMNGWAKIDTAEGNKELLARKRQMTFPDYFADIVDDPKKCEIHEPVEIGDYYSWFASHKSDIGLAPLHNCAFNRSKSNLKYLEYGALGLPGVYADMDIYDVRHGETGFLAKKPIDYYKYMKRLILDAGFRESMGQAAYEDVKERYPIQKSAEKMSALIRRLGNEKVAAVSPAVAAVA